MPVFLEESVQSDARCGQGAQRSQGSKDDAPHRTEVAHEILDRNNSGVQRFAPFLGRLVVVLLPLGEIFQLLHQLPDQDGVRHYWLAPFFPTMNRLMNSERMA